MKRGPCVLGVHVRWGCVRGREHEERSVYIGGRCEAGGGVRRGQCVLGVRVRWGTRVSPPCPASGLSGLKLFPSCLSAPVPTPVGALSRGTWRLP